MRNNAAAKQHLPRLTALGVLLTGVLVLVVGCPTPPPPGGEPPPSAATAPGLAIELINIAIPADLRPEVAFDVTENNGNRVPIAELTDLRFALAYLDEAPGGSGATRFVNYTPRERAGVTQATSDPARLSGVTHNPDGTYRYKFQVAIPANYDRTATHQLGAQARRRYPVNGTIYPAEAVSRLRFDGQPVVATRELVATETCNQCHTRLGAHGDVRRDVQHCILCHTPQTFDDVTGRSLDFAEMIHKIHRGHDLPSVQDGEHYVLASDDFSDVAFPQDIRNCTACHSAAPGALAHLEQPTSLGCASCHDRTWFGNPALTPVEFANHSGGQQVNDSLCSLCHTPTAPGVSPIHEAHLLPTERPTAPGLALDIINVATAPVDGGTALTITFTAVDKDGAPYETLAPLAALASTVAYPAGRYETNVRETFSPANMPANLGNGVYQYTFNAVLPEASSDTFAVGMEGRVPFMHDGQSFNQGTATNGLAFFTIDDTPPSVPPAIIAAERCDDCHREVRFHGGGRVGADYCALCHHVNATDIARRPAGAMPPVTVNFKEMIHKIHTGKDLNQPYTVYGFGNRSHDFTEVRFPGLRQQCSICHVNDSQHVPLPDDAMPTVVMQGDVLASFRHPESAACNSCHDSLIASVHSMLATDLEQGVETCAVCHGRDAAFAVGMVHALAP